MSPEKDQEYSELWWNDEEYDTHVCSSFTPNQMGGAGSPTKIFSLMKEDE
jgi:hypothetical protein